MCVYICVMSYVGVCLGQDRLRKVTGRLVVAQNTGPCTIIHARLKMGKLMIKLEWKVSVFVSTQSH
jgi:hypothetical protein